MLQLTPKAFWCFYRERLRGNAKDEQDRRRRWQAFQTNHDWTPVALEAAEAACKEYGCTVERENFRVDLNGIDKPADRQPVSPIWDWDFRVAFEHENEPSWRQELCKLAHIAADLCVVAAFYEPGENIEEELGNAVGAIIERMTRVPGRQWLFVFGPNIHVCRADPEACFKAFTLGQDCQIVPLLEGPPLQPAQWTDE